MDFSLTDEQQAIRELAAKILGDHCMPDVLRAVEDSDAAGFDRALWAKLVEAGLLGVCVEEAYGGLGLGFLELALLLEEVGRVTAPVPVFATLALGAMPVSRYGSKAQQDRLLPAVARGEQVLTAALIEPLGDPLEPSTTARRDGECWVLDGTKICVPAGLSADVLLVSARTDSGAAIFLVDAAAPGVAAERVDTISYIPEAQITLTGVVVEADAILGGADGAALADTVRMATAATCAVTSGVVATAVRLISDYTTTREQFGRPIAMFQAVGQRAADAYIDTTAIRLTMLQAVWRVSVGMPADKEVAVAKYFASDGGQRVVRAAAHLHGGMGVSREYPLHRHYAWAKQLELTLGSGTRQLVRLGRLLADEPVRA